MSNVSKPSAAAAASVKKDSDGIDDEIGEDYSDNYEDDGDFD